MHPLHKIQQLCLGVCVHDWPHNTSTLGCSLPGEKLLHNHYQCMEKKQQPIERNYTYVIIFMEAFPKELSSSLHILGFTCESSWTFGKQHTWSMCSQPQHNCLLWVVFCHHIHSFYYGTLKEIILWNLLLFLSQDIVRTIFIFFLLTTDTSWE